MYDEQPHIRAARKDAHVELAEQQRAHNTTHNEFDDVQFVHHALRGIDQSSVSLDVTVGEWQWQTPFYINGMTGGTPQAEAINRQLAIAAREMNVPVACGSVSVALDAPQERSIVRSFTVLREENPDGFVMANIGVGRPAEDAVRAVELLHADALQVHINSVQETAMPEGGRDFSHWQQSVEDLIAASPVPVIVKEVGFGLSRNTLEQLTGIGATLADVGGKGGTDFLRIENARHTNEQQDFSMLSGYGQSAIACLLDAPASGPELLASGGVRNPFDVIKALASGAKAVGVAGTFLQVVRAGGAEALVPYLQTWKHHTTAIMALLGAQTASELMFTDMLVTGNLAVFCELRGIDLSALTRRSNLS